jgi:CheY-like chemotaxis protein
MPFPSGKGQLNTANYYANRGKVNPLTTSHCPLGFDNNAKIGKPFGVYYSNGTFMPIDLIAIAFDQILELAKEKGKRSEKILKALNAIGLKQDAPLDKGFDGVYAYTLVIYGIDKPKPILEFFRHEFIKRAFRKSFEQRDSSILEEETENFLDWNQIGKDILAIDYEPRREFAEFREQFIAGAKLTRSPQEVLVDQKLDELPTKNYLDTKFEPIYNKLNTTPQKQEDKTISFEKSIPPMPSYFMERNEYTDTIKNLLLQDSKNVGITGVSHTIGLQGMGGIGKSIIAIAIAHDEQIRDAFPDGIIWATLGQNLSKDKIPEVQNQILNCFDELEVIPESPQKGLELLKNRFSGKRILLILDDVWDIKNFEYFDISFGESRLLVTTRHSQILTSIDAEECKIDVLSQEQSLQLLRKQSKWADNVALPESAQEIVKQCGGLPLALSMIGAMLKDKPSDRWAIVLKHLKNADLKSIKQKIKGYFHENLFAALHVSVEDQPQPNRNCYVELAVFPKDTLIPESVLEFYWDKDELEGKESIKVIDELVDASLIFRYDNYSLMLHDLQRDYVYSQCSDIHALHQKIVDAYAEKYPAGWDTIPHTKPTYFENYFAYHLQQLTDKKKSQKLAEELLNSSNGLNWISVLQCAEIVGKTPRQVAQQTIKISRVSNVLYRCIQILRHDAKEDARRLLQESKVPEVIIVCLKLLGSDAKEAARRLLQESKEHQVITVCLNLLGEEAKEDARRLLQESKEHQVITVCLNLLGEEAKEDARRLLQESKDSQVVTVCLKLLGSEAKEDARRLLQESKDSQVVTVCLKLLGSDAKEDARRLLQESKVPEVIIVCLKLLGSDAKEDARRLLQESKVPEIVTVCLKLLGSDAKEDARRLLQENKNLTIQVACFNILGSEANEEALEVLNNWRSKPRFLVFAALKVFSNDPDQVERYCRYILKNWEHDIEYSIKKNPKKKFSRHITLALTHPKLKTTAKVFVAAMLKREEQSPGFLHLPLLKIAQAISEGKTFVWGEEIEPELL